MIILGESKIQTMLNNLKSGDINTLFNNVHLSVLRAINEYNFRDITQSKDIFYNYEDDQFTTDPELGETFFVTEFNIKMYMRNEELKDSIETIKHWRSSDSQKEEAELFLFNFINEKLKSKIIKDSSLLKTSNTYFENYKIEQGYVAFDELTQENLFSLTNYIISKYKYVDSDMPDILRDYYENVFLNKNKDVALNGELSKLSKEAILELSYDLSKNSSASDIVSILENNEANPTIYSKDYINRDEYFIFFNSLDLDLIDFGEYIDRFIDCLNKLLNLDPFMLYYMGDLGLISIYELSYDKNLDMKEINILNKDYVFCVKNLLIDGKYSSVSNISFNVLYPSFGTYSSVQLYLSNNKDVKFHISRKNLNLIKFNISTFKHQLDNNIEELLDDDAFKFYKYSLDQLDEYVNFLESDAIIF